MVESIKETLERHALWLSGSAGGKRADLRRANLEGANLEGANLREADLREANLEGANLREANLEGANLREADLEGANLREANLERAILEGANLWGANLREANLREANLWGANLEGANLRGADLRRADLRRANLERAILEGANLWGANLPHFQICPQEGSFIAYKKTTLGVIKVLIPEGAKRTNSLVGRKCRTSKLMVLGGDGVGGTGPTYGGIIYSAGATIECLDYDDDIRVECTKGIHFFMTEQEAKDW